jgi:hypothetical protein
MSWPIIAVRSPMGFSFQYAPLASSRPARFVKPSCMPETERLLNRARQRQARPLIFCCRPQSRGTQTGALAATDGTCARTTSGAALESKGSRFVPASTLRKTLPRAHNPSPSQRAYTRMRNPFGDRTRDAGLLSDSRVPSNLRRGPVLWKAPGAPDRRMLPKIKSTH